MMLSCIEAACPSYSFLECSCCSLKRAACLRMQLRYEVSRTDTTEVEIVYPPDERSEVAAAEIVGPLQAHLILV